MESKSKLKASRGQTKNLESIIVEQLGEPEEIRLFSEFEELAKSYAIELPLVSRTRVERLFEVYDGRKLVQSGGTDDDEAEGDVFEPSTFEPVKASEEQVPERRDQTARRARKWRHGKQGGLTWCRMLFDHNKLTGGSCCISRSETSQFGGQRQSDEADSLGWLSSLDTLDGLLASNLPGSGTSEENEPGSESRESEEELRAEVIQLFRPLLKEIQSWSISGVEQARRQQQFSVLSDVTPDVSSQVSVCLIDKRNRTARSQQDAECGQRWSFLNSQLDELRTRLMRDSSCQTASRKELERKVDQFLHDRLKSFESGFERDSGAREKLSRLQFERLIEQTKNSLNNLIDAQLLLRNKLNQEQEQQQQQQFNTPSLQPQPSGFQFSLLTSHCDTYETLLRNNFNLLKIWQNLEETKKLACFVCEPIKANLGDLFWFNRERRFHHSDPSESQRLFSSPLVSLDAIQVKRGLLQILEALNFLHAHCKLIHRDVNPRNILVASNDNWKLGGLQFAVKFESATISESASVMRFELAGATLRFSGGSGSKSNLRRQRTLHQTKCDQYDLAPKSAGFLQPELDYLAPEVFRSAQCSHKSDIFSWGLVLAQTYELGVHNPPISCHSNPANYETEIEKLNALRKRKLCRLVPFEMKLVLLEMLECEPNLRPSASLAIQLLRRPIDLCKENEDSLRHLRQSLSYLESSTSQSNQAANSQNFSAKTKSRTRFFRKVILAADRAPHRKQPRNLQMLNLFWRALDSLASINNPQADFPHSTPPLAPLEPRGANFPAFRSQFELSLAALKQLYKLARAYSPYTTPDSRILMLTVALHRRLLNQMSAMRLELPPMSRLTSSKLLSQNHRILVELEDQFVSLVCRHSIPKLTPFLTDPTLKLDEFIIVHELVNDLAAFVGLSSRQRLTQRARLLLNDLTPPTGGLSTSSSSEEEENSELNLEPMASDSIQSGRNSAPRFSGNVTRRFTSNELDDPYRNIKQNQQPRLSTQMNPRHSSQQPTRISITAPSPMGSMKDVNRASMRSQQVDLSGQFQSNVDDQLIERTRDLRLEADQSDEVNDLVDTQSPQADATAAPAVKEEQEREQDKSRSQLIDELLSRINDDSFNDIVDLNNKFASIKEQSTIRARPKSAMDGMQASSSQRAQQYQPRSSGGSQRPRKSVAAPGRTASGQQQGSTFDNVIRRMSTNIVQNFNRMSATTLGATDQQDHIESSSRRGIANYANSLYVENQVPTRRHSDNTINIPKIQVGHSSPQSQGSRSSLNQRGSSSVTKLANKWKMSAKTNQKESSDKLSPTLNSALGYMRRHSSGNTTDKDQNQSNGHSSNLLFSASPFKTKSSSNLGLDFLLSNKSMKRRCSAASMLGHQTQRRAEDLIDAGMKSVQNMFS